MARRVRRLAFFRRPENARARRWEAALRRRLAGRHPRVRVVDSGAEGVVVLGGDGTLLEAARRFAAHGPVLLGLNLGHVGFLSSAREPRQFAAAIDRFLAGDYRVAERLLLQAAVLRGGRRVFAARAFNEVVVANPLGMVGIEAAIGGAPVQRIHGSGVLVATATGSTAWNLSAHGPVVMPDIRCLVLTELMDHGIPTPSVVLAADRPVTLRLLGFRARGLLSLTATGERVDVLLVADGETLFPLRTGDEVVVRRARRPVRLAELEEGYFFRSLRERVSFR